MGNEPMNVPNIDASHRGEINEHQNVAELVVQRDLVALSTTHQKTPQTITQPRVMNVYNDDNHEPI
jgi:hypothetical protein